MSRMKVKKKNTLRADAKNKKYTFDEVNVIKRKIEDAAIVKMTDACYFAHSLTLIVLQDQFGFGPKRRAKFIAEFNHYCRDYADGKFPAIDVIDIGNDLEAACDKYIEEMMR